ncbi:putative endoglucanase type K [Fusarium floridanum]|uniref:Cellulase n=2 Tax=Fusarium solani species complex TaxID=232080 RepID=A0A428RUZ0_9HYPO|nr:putative endoglucanase type K [Fusarium floridanum]RSM04529.1 putative endoglucanase type K [Fusarium ambrosium]
MRSSTLIALAGPLAVRAASGNGHSTRYWDCCKPSCSWADKAAVSAPALTCDKNDNPISDANAKSGCDGGSAFACTNYSPWAVNDNLAYGFAATKLSGGSEATWCCACYSLTFTTGPVKGKTMVVQSTNTGGDLGENHFDLQMPGGGVGIFDGCSSQFGGSGLGGAQYGGISARSDCDSFPELLKDGCYWRFDWFENADNPDFTFEQVQCPKALTDISGCTRDDDSSFPAFSGDTSSSGSSSGSGSSSKASTSKAAVQTQKTQAPATEQKSTQVQQQPSNVQTQVQSSASQPQQTQAPVQEPATSKTTKATAKASATKSAAASAQSAVAAWYQCGGSKSAYPDGNLPCASGSTCVQHNEYYSQCVPN